MALLLILLAWAGVWLMRYRARVKQRNGLIAELDIALGAGQTLQQQYRIANEFLKRLWLHVGRSQQAATWGEVWANELATLAEDDDQHAAARCLAVAPYQSDAHIESKAPPVEFAKGLIIKWIDHFYRTQQL